MRISIYMEYLAYKFGGAESYAANLIEVLQNIYAYPQIKIITESFGEFEKLPVAEFVEKLNKSYGTSICGHNVSISYFYFGKKMKFRDRNRFRRLLNSIPKVLIMIPRRFKTIQGESEGSDLFINASFNIIAGRAKKNICIVHFPFQPIERQKSLKENIKNILTCFQNKKMDFLYATSYDKYLPNSFFTSGWLKEYWEIPDEKIEVLYPPVKMVDKKNVNINRKKNQILACGRIAKDKQIEKLIIAYKNSPVLHEKSELVIAGSVIGEAGEYVDEIKNLDSKVRLVLDPPREELENLYLSSGVFLHIKGADEDDPALFEHFGMTTVEAMSGGCIPIVICKGGQREIVTDDCGFRCGSMDELVKKTENVIFCEDYESLRHESIKRSLYFSKEKFAERFKLILSEVVGA